MGRGWRKRRGKGGGGEGKGHIQHIINAHEIIKEKLN